MTSPPAASDGSSADECAELRATVEQVCAQAREAKIAHDVAAERIRELRRELTAAQHKRDEAVAAEDPSLRAAEKTAALDSYRLARTTAADEDELREATAVYARTIDRINRERNLRQRAVHKMETTVADIETAIGEAERTEQSSRMRADQTEAACLDARVRLAACEEGAGGAAEAEHADVFEPHAATGGHAVAISGSADGAPLVIESLVSGDRLALELTATRVAEHTGASPAEAQLQLQELVDATVSAASAAGYLVFDTSHRFWSALTFEEARDTIAALERLGFVLEPAEGWHAGRAPAPSDLSMALAYAGLDARNMRDLPTAEELAALPGSIAVDARAFLVAEAPRLTVDNVVHALGRRAETLESLWDEWGQVRPILLTDRHALGSLPG